MQISGDFGCVGLCSESDCSTYKLRCVYGVYCVYFAWWYNDAPVETKWIRLMCDFTHISQGRILSLYLLFFYSRIITNSRISVVSSCSTTNTNHMHHAQEEDIFQDLWYLTRYRAVCQRERYDALLWASMTKFLGYNLCGSHARNSVKVHAAKTSIYDQPIVHFIFLDQKHAIMPRMRQHVACPAAAALWFHLHL